MVISMATAGLDPRAKTGNPTNIRTTTDLKDFFRIELTQAASNHNLHIGDATLWYLTQLLYNYRKTDQLFDYHVEGGTLTPLAEYYRQATEATSTHERKLYLQKLGDVSIFISSLFAGALKRKPVNVSYYMSMGESAYGSLADAPAHSSRDRALADIYEELSHQFCSLVGVIREVKQGTDNPRPEQITTESATEGQTAKAETPDIQPGIILSCNGESLH